MKRFAVLAAAVVLTIAAPLVAVPPAGALERPLCPSDFRIDFSGTEYADCFRDIYRGSEIDTGVDVGGTGHASLNFTGSTGPASTWLTIYSANERPREIFELVRLTRFVLCADVLVERFNNTKGAGVVGLFNPRPGLQGLGMIVYDAGNTDTLALVTVDGDPAGKGKLTNLQTVSLKGKIGEKAWYRVIMEAALTGDPEALAADAILRVGGAVYGHVNPADPDSPLDGQIGTTLDYLSTSVPPSITPPGFFGLIGTAVSSAVNASITNFSNDARTCFPRPAPPDEE